VAVAPLSYGGPLLRLCRESTDWGGYVRSRRLGFRRLRRCLVTIRAAVRYLLKGAAGTDRGDIVREIIKIVSEEASGLPPDAKDPFDDDMPGG
jgi:hypothetical protein